MKSGKGGGDGGREEGEETSSRSAELGSVVTTIEDVRALRVKLETLLCESGLKIDFIVRRADAHSVAEFARRRRVPLLPDFAAFVASPEDVILKKLVYFCEGGSEKHMTDIKGILTQTAVDLAYVDRWAESMGLTAAWTRARV